MIDVLVFDTYGGPHPRKRRRFPKNAEAVEVSQPEPEEAEEVSHETDEEPYTGPDEEPPTAPKSITRMKRKKGK